MEERQQQIKKLLERQGKVTVSKLAAKFAVSAATIRHDLAEMEKAGLLARTFGGAVTAAHLSPNFSYEEKKLQHRQAKKLIAQTASHLLKAGMTLFLDAGTSSFELLPYLGQNQLRIFTVDLNLALRLAALTNVDAFMLGGRISHKTASTDSVTTVEQISQPHFNLAFLGCDGFDSQQVYITSENKAALKTAVLAQSDRSVLLADSSKYGQKAVRTFAQLCDLSYVVCEKAPAAQLPQVFKDKLLIGGKEIG